MDFFRVRSLEDTRELMKREFTYLYDRKERISLEKSLGKYTAEEIIARDSVPRFNKSTVDGYAVKAEATYGASDVIPSMFDLIGEATMGRETKQVIKEGETMYVPTGGMIPEGASAVVMIEYSEKMGEEIFLNASSVNGENIIFVGEDIKEGDIVLGADVIIKPRNIGSLAAVGVDKVLVKKKPTFYIISTGDEVKSVGEELKLGEIRDINTHTLKATIEEEGAKVNGRSLVGDTLEVLKQEIAYAMEVSDVVLLSGGSSVGNKDYTCRAIEELGGEILVHGISMKPGKPTIVAKIDGKLVVGLPGHPVSALMVLKALFEDVFGRKRSQLIELGRDIHSTPGRTTYQPIKIDGNKVIPVYGKSGVINLLNIADGYIIISTDKEGCNQGELVEVWTF